MARQANILQYINLRPPLNVHQQTKTLPQAIPTWLQKSISPAGYRSISHRQQKNTVVKRAAARKPRCSQSGIRLLVRDFDGLGNRRANRSERGTNTSIFENTF